MTVPVQTPVTSSTANGVTTVFPYGFKIAAAEDLAVTVDGVRLTSGYTVSGVGNPAGGNVTITIPPANGAKVVRYLVPILKRDTDYQQFGDWLAAVVNLDFDRIWLTLQTLQQNNIRSLKLPVDTIVDQVLTQDATARANRTIKFDGAGNLTISTYDPDAAQAAAAGSATAAAASQSAASTSATNAANSATAAASSASNAASSATAAATAAARPARALNAVIDGGLDNTGVASVTAAFNTLLSTAASGGYFDIYFPPGTYKFSTKPNAITNAVCLRGDPNFSGPSASFVRAYTPVAGDPFLDFKASEISLRYLSLLAGTGTSNGYAINCVHPGGAAGGYDFCSIDHIYVSGAGLWEKALNIDGSARSGGMGVRDWFILNSRFYQFTVKGIHAKTAVDFNWIGSGVFATGGGSPTHHMHIDGAVGAPSTCVNIVSDYLGVFEITRCNYAQVSAPFITSVTIDINTVGALVKSGNHPTISNASTTSGIISGAALVLPGSLVGNSGLIAGEIGTGAGPLAVTKQGTAPSGTGNVYGFNVTPQASGEILLDALTSGVGSAFMSVRTYNNGTYHKSASFLADGRMSLETGVAFPATQVASSDPNTLDDYEEGTFTPTLNGWTNVGTPTVSGVYTKKGREVTFTISVIPGTTIACTAGTSTITGLPFAQVGNSVCSWASSNTGLNPGNALITGSTINTITQGATGSTLYVSGTYNSAT